MPESKILTVLTDFHTFSEIIISPNDGYDLGLLELTKNVKVIANGESFEGRIFISNDCKDSTVILNNRLHQRIGKPDNVKLSVNGNNLIIHNQ